MAWGRARRWWTMPRIKKTAKITSYHTPSLRSNPILPFPRFFAFSLRAPCLPLMTCEDHSLNNYMYHTSDTCKWMHVSNSSTSFRRRRGRRHRSSISADTSLSDLSSCLTRRQHQRNQNWNQSVEVEAPRRKANYTCTCKASLFSEDLFPIWSDQRHWPVTYVRRNEYWERVSRKRDSSRA